MRKYLLLFTVVLSLDPILHAQNVGIGTSNPLSKLDVKGGMAVGSYAGATAAPANGLIVSGNLGIGYTNPAYTIEANGSIRSAGSLINGAFDFILGNGDQSSRGNSGSSRALVKDGGNVLDINYGGDFSGGTRVSNLTGTGNRAVYVDGTGLLKASTKNVAYVFTKAQNTIGYPGNHNDVLTFSGTPAAFTTTSLNVETGDVVVINGSWHWKMGGSGTDQPKWGFRISGSCGTIDLKDNDQFEMADNIGREFQMNGEQKVWVATCSGTITVQLGVSFFNTDDTETYSDICITATRY